jgi:putative ABC transport system ATP-binding protein
MSAMPAGISVIDVSKRYGAAEQAFSALEGINLHIAPGEFIALMGPSGCGKSTLLNIIGGIDRPTAGKVLLDGTDLAALSDDALTRLRQQKLGFIFQFFNLLSTLTVLENVMLPLELAGNTTEGEARRRAEALLKQVGLNQRINFYPSQLSGGEMQRTAIARALIHQPQIILADEPTGNLDSENGAHILALLKSLCRENGQTILMATHSDEAAVGADRVIRMRDGRLASQEASA